MTRLHQRIITVDALSEPELSPADKRLLYVGLMMLADDSGCVRWDARTIRGNVFPYGDLEHARIVELMAEYEADGLAWPYTADDGREYAHLPAFPHWQKSRTRQFAPEVPQPAGIIFDPALDKANRGSGQYVYPKTAAELNPSQTSQGSDLEALNPSEENGSCLKGAARKPRPDPQSDPQGGPQSDPLAEAIAELVCATGSQPSVQEQERLGRMIETHGGAVLATLTARTPASFSGSGLSVSEALDQIAEALS